jgi:hypothetical protein
MDSSGSLCWIVPRRNSKAWMQKSLWLLASPHPPHELMAGYSAARVFSPALNKEHTWTLRTVFVEQQVYLLALLTPGIKYPQFEHSDIW